MAEKDCAPVKVGLSVVRGTPRIQTRRGGEGGRAQWVRHSGRCLVDQRPRRDFNSSRGNRCERLELELICQTLSWLF